MLILVMVCNLCMLNEQKWRGQNLRSGKQVPNASFENLASRLDLEEWDGQMPNYLERAGRIGH